MNQVQTSSILLQTLFVPCGCHCRYCLLSWDGKLPGAGDERSQAFVRRFAAWIRAERPEIKFHFGFGYSMEHPRLPKVLDFLNAIGSVSGRFLQLNGLKLRDKEASAAFMSTLAKHGVTEVNFTFYGLTDYHDRFCGTQGMHFRKICFSQATAMRIRPPFSSKPESRISFRLTQIASP